MRVRPTFIIESWHGVRHIAFVASKGPMRRSKAVSLFDNLIGAQQQITWHF
jgi:hypothetical protein